MKQPILEIGGEGWAAKDKVLLGYVKGSDVEGVAPRILQSERGSNLAATRVTKDGSVSKGRWNVLQASNAFNRWYDYGGYQPHIPDQPGYDGENNAWKITKDVNVGDGNLNKYILSQNLVSLTGLWTYSIYAKAGTLKALFLYTGDGSASDGNAVFNLETGEVHDNYLPAGGHAEIKSVGNGWYRCSVTSLQSTSGYRFRFKPTNAGPGPVFTSHNDGSGYLWVQDAQAELGHMATDPIVTGTKVNYITNSNYIHQTDSWSESLSIVRPGQEGYDGTHNAHYLSKNGAWQNIQHDLAKNSTGEQTISIYAKAADSEALVIRAYLDGSQQAEARYQLRRGFVESYSGNKRVSDAMTDVGNGWWRCELRLNGTIDRMRFYPAASDGTGAGGTEGSIYVQNPQLEAGLEATEYVDNLSFSGPLQDEPRIDYRNGKAQLLIENDRVNNVEFSEYFEHSSWLTINSIGLERGYEAPDGSMTAYKVTNLSPSSGAALYTNKSDIIREGTRSIWARTVSGTSDFNLLTYGENTDNVFTVTEEWQRFELTGSPFGAGFSNLYAVDFRGGVHTLNEIILWGAQHEDQDHATSYIPSYGVKGSRSNDNIDTLNYSHFEDLGIGQAHTVMFDFDATTNLDDNTILFDLHRTQSPQSAIQARWFGDNSGNPGFKVYDSVDPPAYPLGSAVHGSSTKKWVIRINGTNFSLFYNDNGTPTQATGSVNARDLVGLRIRGAKCYHNGIKVFDSALSDSECMDLVK